MTDLTEMAQSLRTLMIRLEQLLVLLHEQQLVYWPDWGTLLGIERHRNVIPWDYDVDLCMPAADYQKLIALFEQNGGKIGELELHLNYYDDPAGALAILFSDVPDASLGIDVVAYRQEGDQLLNNMSPQLQADYPGNYDFPVAQVLPLRWGHLLGQPVLMPQQAVARLEGLFGDWQAFPEGYAASGLTERPFIDMPDTPQTAGPWIARAPTSAMGDAWAQPGYVAGTRAVRWLTQADAQAQGIDARTLAESPFTDLVYRNDRALWGKIWVGTLFPGDRLMGDRSGAGAQCGCFDARPATSRSPT